MAAGQREQALEEEVLGPRAQASALAGQGQPAARPQDPVCLGERSGGVGQVGKRLAHGDQVERIRPEHEVLGGHADELDILGLVRPRDREHVLGQVDADDQAGVHPGRQQVGDQPRARAYVQHLLVLGRGRQVDQPRRHATVLTACPCVVNRSDSIEKVDQVLDHLVRGIRVHQCHDVFFNLCRRLGARLLRC